MQWAGLSESETVPTIDYLLTRPAGFARNIPVENSARFWYTGPAS